MISYWQNAGAQLGWIKQGGDNTKFCAKSEHLSLI
jgi:hypothetical protein